MFFFFNISLLKCFHKRYIDNLIYILNQLEKKHIGQCNIKRFENTSRKIQNYKTVERYIFLSWVQDINIYNIFY